MINISKLDYYYEKTSYKYFFKKNTEKIQALSNISFSIKEGEIVAIVGKNGAGKTTLIKIMTGLISTEEKVEVLGYKPSDKNKNYLNQIGFVFGHKSQLIWDLPPQYSLLLQKEIYGVSTQEFKERLNSYTTLFEVDHLIDKPVKRLSLGERVKFEIICSLIYNPKILFLDEPTLGLDLVSQESLYKVLESLNKEKKITIILTSHNTNDLDRLATRILFLSDKTIKYDESKEEFLNLFSNEKYFKVKVQGEFVCKYDYIKLEKDYYKISTKDTFQEIVLYLSKFNEILEIEKENENLNSILYKLMKNSEKDSLENNKILSNN